MTINSNAHSQFDEEGVSVPAETDTYLTFSIGSQVFAVDVKNVREILDLQTISKLPNAPHDVMGVIDVRDQGICVIDLASRLGMSLDNNENSRIVVFELDYNDDSTPIGVIADRVLSVAEIAQHEIEAPPATLSTWDPSAVHGVARLDGEVVIVLILSQVFGTLDRNNDPFTFSDSVH